MKLRIISLMACIMSLLACNAQDVKENNVDTFTSANGTKINMHCIKHGSLSINVGGKWIYIDPVTDKVQPATDYTTMPKADYILVTHEHADHLDAKAIEQLTKDGTTLIVNPRSSEILGGKGDTMKNGDTKKWRTLPLMLCQLTTFLLTNRNSIQKVVTMATS